MTPHSSLQVSAAADGRVFVGASQYYGIVGNGSLTLLDPSCNYSARWQAATAAGVFACEGHPQFASVAAAACADGTVQVFNCASDDTRPVRIWAEHKVESSCVSWAPAFNGTLASGGWDGQVHLHSVAQRRALRCISMPKRRLFSHTLGATAPPGRSACSFSRSGCSVHSLQWHPTEPCTILAGAASGQCCIVDIRAAQPVSWDADWGGGGTPPEVLCAQWAGGGQCVVAATSHGALVAFDIRKLQQPLSHHAAHSLGVRCMAVSPPGLAGPQLLATGSYDCAVKLWSVEQLLRQQGMSAAAAPLSTPLALVDASSALLGTLQQHSEFVTGAAWLPHSVSPGLVSPRLATVSWDETIVIVGPQAWN